MIVELTKSELKTLELALQTYYWFIKSNESPNLIKEKELEHIEQVKKTLKI